MDRRGVDPVAAARRGGGRCRARLRAHGARPVRTSSRPHARHADDARGSSGSIFEQTLVYSLNRSVRSAISRPPSALAGPAVGPGTRARSNGSAPDVAVSVALRWRGDRSLRRRGKPLRRRRVRGGASTAPAADASEPRGRPARAWRHPASIVFRPVAPVVKSLHDAYVDVLCRPRRKTPPGSACQRPQARFSSDLIKRPCGARKPGSMPSA